MIGLSGCGKIECIKIFVVVYREMGYLVKMDIVCIEVVEFEEFFGYMDFVGGFVL